MIYLIGEAPVSRHYLWTKFEELMNFLRSRKGKTVQLDIETNVTQYWCTKKLITLQFGSADGKQQYVVQWSALTEAQRMQLTQALEEWDITWIIHNAMFECIVMLFQGVRLRKVWCTMIAEMILYTGIHTQDDQEFEENETVAEAGFFSLAKTNFRYLGTDIDKTEQMNFGDDILTESKVLYAAGDVKPLWLIRRDQMMLLHDQELDWVAALEMEAVLGYAEMTFHGMDLNTDEWLANLELALPIQAAAKEELDQQLRDPSGPFQKKAIELGYYHPRDVCTINWNSPKQKGAVIGRFFPFLVGKAGKPAMERLVRDHQNGRSPQHPAVIEWTRAFLAGDAGKIEASLIETDRQWLIDNELLTPADAVTINWNAWQQALPIFQAFDPKLKSTSKKDMGGFLHPIGALHKKYKDALKLTTTYGEKFITDHIEPDGKIRTNINPIVSTGRVSSWGPNLQQIPVRDPVGNRYINCFHAPQGWEFVMSDYASQELVMIATLGGEKAWLEALKKHQDLHSVCAELVFPKEWKAGMEQGCDYYRTDYWSETLQCWRENRSGLVAPDWKEQPRHAKCKCKQHKIKREPVKNIDFGMAYGMSKYKLAGDMKWPIKRAEETISSYFKLFPGLKKILNYFAWFGLTRGYIMTIEPFFRKRWFPDAKYYSMEEINAHWQDIKFSKRLGQIERAAKNMPIQGSSADCTKLAMVLLYHYIHDNHLEDKVYLTLQVHDSNMTACRADFVEEWTPILDRIMHEAALFIIPSGLLRAETDHSPVWTK